MEIPWEKHNDIDTATDQIKTLMTLWANVGGAGGDENQDAYLWGRLHDHVADLILAVHGVRWKGGVEYPAEDAEEEAKVAREQHLTEPAGSPSEQAFAAEMRRRMEELEEAYKNAPRITAGALDGWANDLRAVEQQVYAALETVDLLNSEERVATDFFGPLTLVSNALNMAHDDLAAMGQKIHDAKKAAEPDGGAS